MSTKSSYTFFLFLYFFSFISLSLSLSLLETSKIYPLYKISFAKDLKDFSFYTYRRDIKGIGIIFDYNSEFSQLPGNLFLEIKGMLEKKMEQTPDSVWIEDFFDDYKVIISDYYSNYLFPINFIMENFGIKIPDKFFFIQENFGLIFRFFSNFKNDNIIIGKDLIDLMNIEFMNNDNNNNGNEFIIHNQDFILNLDDNDDNDNNNKE